MGELAKSQFEFVLQDASADDLRDIAEIFIRSMAWDPMTKLLDLLVPFEQQVQWKVTMDRGRMTLGHELGVCKTWKVVDENGKTIAWGGLGLPAMLTEEQSKAIKGHASIANPPNMPEGLAKYMEWGAKITNNCMERNGYDPTIHFARQGTMVDALYQRKGIGRMITKKCNEIADEKGAATFVKARPSSRPLFEQEGYKVLETIPIHYEDFGWEGHTELYVMKREPGGK